MLIFGIKIAIQIIRHFVCLFVLILYVPVNNLSTMSGRFPFFLCWASTIQGIKDHRGLVVIFNCTPSSAAGTSLLHYYFYVLVTLHTGEKPYNSVKITSVFCSFSFSAFFMNIIDIGETKDNNYHLMKTY